MIQVIFVVKVTLKIKESKLFSVSANLQVIQGGYIKDQNIKPIYTYDNSLDFRTRIIFESQCLKQDQVKFDHKTVVNIYIAYKINLWRFK